LNYYYFDTYFAIVAGLCFTLAFLTDELKIIRQFFEARDLNPLITDWLEKVLISMNHVKSLKSGCLMKEFTSHAAINELRYGYKNSKKEWYFLKSNFFLFLKYRKHRRRIKKELVLVKRKAGRHIRSTLKFKFMFFFLKGVEKNFSFPTTFFLRQFFFFSGVYSIISILVFAKIGPPLTPPKISNLLALNMLFIFGIILIIIFTYIWFLELKGVYSDPAERGIPNLRCKRTKSNVWIIVAAFGIIAVVIDVVFQNRLYSEKQIFGKLIQDHLFFLTPIFPMILYFLRNFLFPKILIEFLVLPSDRVLKEKHTAIYQEIEEFRKENFPYNEIISR